ncbi:response regulator [Flagellimonas lutaonensis]|uniref:response regulator n=1 Tax=Flagellimonas lutaonensis TaxID=516051 RepID=UPI0005F86719|nr:response regulator [Allomuricauda lutaonensis]
MKKIKCACVIDDDPICTYWTKKMMDELMFSEDTLIYENGQDALEGLKNIIDRGEQLPEVILLDLNMPIMDGWDFLEDFVKLPNHSKGNVHVYIVSSSVAQQDLERAKKFDVVNNYILKPLTHKELTQILKAVA